VNATAPNPVTNAEFTKALGRAVRRPTFLPSVPGFVLRTMLGEFAGVLLASQRAIPQALLDAGYKFEFANLDAALADILQPSNYDERPSLHRSQRVQAAI
jgi:uncharacterized protein